MTYLQIFALFAIVAFVASRCIGGTQKRLITAGQHEGHELAVYQHSTSLGIGVTGHSAHLFFDQKEVDQWHHTWPILPEDYPNWVVKTYSEAPDSWTAYLSPSHFSRSDFDLMVACYETNRAAMDSEMKAKFNLYDTERYQVFGRFIYGERPAPMIFKPTALRYQAFTGYGFSDKTVIDREEIVVQPDGKWELQLSQTDGGHSQGGAQLYGIMSLEGGQLYFTPPPESHWHEMPGSLRPDAASREEYLRSFADEQGRRLDAVFVWKN